MGFDVDDLGFESTDPSWVPLGKLLKFSDS